MINFSIQMNFRLKMNLICKINEKEEGKREKRNRKKNEKKKEFVLRNNDALIACNANCEIKRY